ncbi:hypothetical protein BT93_C2250 [Corymbia citriodora subsp. variegata]|nr:hypothetical protein BT93_C2250 [Corymbia citriodora subsp. variegata]
MNFRAKKLRFSRMFRPSFAASCSSRTIDQVIPRSVLIPRPSSRPGSSQTIFGDSDVVSLPTPPNPRHPHRTSSEWYPPSVLRDDDYIGRRCPPSTPVTPFIRRLPRSPVPSLGEINARSGVEPTEKTETKKKATGEGEKEKCPYSSSTTSQEDWFSSDDDGDDDESDVRLSSSRSLSSDSSETRRRTRNRRRRRSGAAGVGVLPLAGGEIEDSFAVVKRSSDPRGDFRRSMVEMIVEKEMFGAEELQKLLECFLALNSHHHHGVILQVFAEIWEALFSSRS